MAIIEMDNLAKFYTIYKNPKDRFKELLFNKQYHKKFWVLKNITITVEKGDIIGIIGKNGAGKSTLLKIISRIIIPSSGKLKILGKVSPILELGMGFHPELTGIENIYLSGRLLGLSNKEIKKNIDAIIDFSELGEFIKQPIKTYSSGMHVRLAFSVATCINPDILVIDEALSVGDAYFQKKSLDKIIEFKKKKKTIIFCSHNMYHITNLCNRVFWLDNGIIRMQGEPKEVVNEYQEFLFEKENNKKIKTDISIESKALVKIIDINLNKNYYKRFEPIELTISYNNPEELPIHAGIVIYKNRNTVYGTSTYHDNLKPWKNKKGIVKFIIPKSPLLEGKFEIVAGIIDDTANLTYDLKSIDLAINKTTKELGFIEIGHKWKIY